MQPDISDIIRRYKDKYNIDLSYMKARHSKYPRFNNGKINKDMPSGAFGGSWSSNNTIYLNPNLKEVIKYYNLEDDEDDLRNSILAHELAHEIYKRKATKELISNTLASIAKEKFTTPYLKTVDKRKLDEEAFCEYLANKIK